MSNTYLGRVLLDVALERDRQTKKHGVQFHLPDGTGPDVKTDFSMQASRTFGELASTMKSRCKRASQNEGGDGTITFEHILTEEYAEALAESDPALLREELIQVMAVAAQWIEKLDREADDG